MSIQLDHDLQIFRDLVERHTDEDDEWADRVQRTDEWLATLSPAEAFAEWLHWQGIIGYDSMIRTAMWDLITSSHEYLTTTDQEKEEWLKKLLGV